MESNKIRTGTTTDLDDFFYGRYEGFERDTQKKCVMVKNHGILVPVEDWREGKHLTGAKIMELADYFYKLGAR